MVRNINIILVLLICLGCRAIYAADIAQAIIFAVLAGVYSYNEYLKSSTAPKLDETTQKQLDEMRNIVSGLSMKSAMKPHQMAEELNKRWF